MQSISIYTDDQKSQPKRPANLYKTSDFDPGNYLDEDDPLLAELAEFRVHLWRNGWPCIPVRHKDRLLKGWTIGELTKDRVRQETFIGTTKLNTSFRCGTVVGVDNDVIEPVAAAAVNHIVQYSLGITPFQRRGSKGAMLVYRNHCPIKKLTLNAADGSRLFEILGDGQQFVAYGRHPDGMDYSWLKDDPFDFRLSDLPEITPEQLQVCYDNVRDLLIGLDYEIGPSNRADIEIAETRVITRRAPTDEDIPALCRAALAAIPNNLDHDQWIDLCLAMRDGGLEFSDWHDFCARWESGTNSDWRVKQAWFSCNPRSITFRTLLKKADDADPSWRRRHWEDIMRIRNAKWLRQMRDPWNIVD